MLVCKLFCLNWFVKSVLQWWKILKLTTPKTKQFVEKIKSLGYADGVLILTDGFDENLYLSSRNLINVMVVEAQYADPVSLVRFPKVLATAGAVKKLEEMLA